MKSASSKAIVRMSRVIAAGREIVFRAMLESDAIREWFGPEGWKTTHVEMDAQVGGYYRFGMQPAEGGEAIFVHGEFREIEPFDRLVYTFIWEAQPEDAAIHELKTDGMETIVTIELQEVAGETHLHLEHTGFLTDESARHHDEGWSSTLKCLTAYVRQVHVVDKGASR